jgi:hypothetical protein
MVRFTCQRQLRSFLNFVGEFVKHSHRFLKILILTDASLAAPRAPINWRRLTRIVGVVVEMESEEISQSAFKLALGEVKVAVAMR